jgi:hypothetical protein
MKSEMKRETLQQIPIKMRESSGDILKTYIPVN